jgi:hypothetical protein
MTPTPHAYWNEYEHGSEAGDHDDDTYVLYIDPNAGDEFPGLTYIKSMLGAPVDHVRHWLKSQKSKGISSETRAVTATSPSETQSLLGARHHSRTNTGSSTAAASSPTDYFSIGVRHHRPPSADNGPTEDESLSSDEERGELHHQYPGGLGLFAFSPPSATVDYKIERYRDKVLTRGVVIAFVAAFMLFGISSLLLVTGRHRLRLEVDAGVTIGSAASLFCACMGLGAMLYRQYPSGPLYSLAVWGAFLTNCALNGMLLVLVVSSSGL